MSISFNQAFGGTGSASLGGWAMPIFSSKSITFAQAGTVVLTVVGTGGGGAANGSNPATGGNSAPWGRKKIKILAGDVLVIAIGAGGLKAAAIPGNGSQGSATTVTLNGSTIMTVQGGEGGVYVTSGTASAPTPAATVTGADYWVPGVRAGSATGANGRSGGAAVDVLSNGTGRSADASNAETLGGSVGRNSGGIPIPWIALADFGFVITDGASASATVGAPGRGGEGALLAGALSGGRGAATGAVNNGGGFGGGGGSGYSLATTGDGGAAYAYLTFTPAE